MGARKALTKAGGIMRISNCATAAMLLAVSVAPTGLAHAQDYLAKSFTLIVPYAAEGNRDIRPE